MIEELVTEILLSYPILAPILFVLIRSLPVIFPPIPGILVDVVGVALFGWMYGLALALAGVTLGAMTAFFIARYYRESLVAKFTSLQKVTDWEEALPEKQKFWSLVWLRIATGPFFDYLSYAAGLTKMKTSIFFWSTLISILPPGFIIYYFGETSFSQGPVGIITFIVSIGVMALVFKRASSFSKEDTNKANV